MPEIVYTLKADMSQFRKSMNDAVDDVTKIGIEGEHSVDELMDAYRDLGKQVVHQSGAKGLKALCQAAIDAKIEAAGLAEELQRAAEAGEDMTEISDALAEVGKQAMGLEAAVEGASAEGKKLGLDLKAIHDELANANGVGDGFFENISKKAREASEGMADIKAAVDVLPGPLKNVANGAVGLLQTFKMFGKLPILIVLQALVVAFQTVTEWMHSTVEGEMEMAKQTAKLDALMAGFKNIMVDAGKSIYEFAKDVGDYMQKSYEWVDKNLGLIVGGIPIIGQFYNGVKLLETLDPSKQLVDTSNLAEAYKHCKNLQELFEQINQDELQLRIDKGNFLKTEAELDTEIRKLQNKIAEGVDPSQKIEAIDKAMEDVNKKYEKQIELAQKEYEILQARQAASENNREDGYKLKELEAQVIRLQGDAAAEQKRLTSQRAANLRAIHTQEVARKKELANLNLEIEKAYIQVKQDSLNKTLALMEIERKKQLQSIKDQEEAWRNAQKRKVVTGTDNKGNDIEEEESYLTEEQMQYLAKKRKQINATTNAEIAKTTKEHYEGITKELVKLNQDLAKEKIQAEEDSLDKTLRLIDEETAARKTAIEEQRKAWLKEYGELTDAQKEYLDKQGEWIQASAEKQKSDALIKTYETTANKFKTIAERYNKDIALLKDQSNRDVATDKLNKDALSLVTSDPKLNANLEQFKATLEDATLTSLNSTIESLTAELNNIADQTSTDALVLRAQLETAKQQALQMQTAMMSKKPSAAIGNLNKQLKSTGTTLRQLGQETGGTFGEVAAVMADIIDTTSTLADAFSSVADNAKKLGDLMVTNTVDTAQGIKEGVDAAGKGIEASERSAVTAIKSMETASVILAIIGAIMQAAQAIAKLAKQEDYMEKVREDVAKTNDAIRKMNNDLDLSRNKLGNAFGSDPFGSLVESTKDATKYLDKFNATIDRIGNNKLFAESSLANMLGFGPTLNDVLSENEKSLSNFEKAFKYIDRMRVQTQHSTLFRNAKYSSIGDLGYDIEQYKDGVLDLEASMNSLAEFKGGNMFKHLDESNQKLIDQMLEEWDAYQEALQQMTDAMKDWFGGVSDAFGDAIVNAFETGEDAAEQFRTSVGDSIRSMIKDMLISQYITSYFDDAAEQITKMQQGAEWQNMTSADKGKALADKVMEAADKAIGQIDAVTEAYSQIDSYLNDKGFTSSTAAENNGTLSGAISGASQESIDLLSGYCNAVRIQQVESIDLLREQLVSLSGIETNTAMAASYCRRIAERLEAQTTEDDTLRAAGL